MRAPLCRSTPPAGHGWPRRCRLHPRRTPSPWLSAFVLPRLAALAAPFPTRHGGAPAAQSIGGPARWAGGGLQPAGGELAAGAGGAAAGGAGGGGGRHRQDAAGQRVRSLGQGARGRSAERAGLRDGGTVALSATGRGTAAATGGGERHGGSAGRPVAGRALTPAAGAAGALS